MKIVRAVGLFASAAFAQMVIGPEQIPCREEVVRSDFERKGKIQVSGELKDLSGAQFVNWKIVLKRANEKEKFVLYRAISTISANKHGHFDLGVGDVDRYRFPLAPKRGFQQPVRVLCREGRDGEINLVLRANPTVGRLSYSITNAQTH